MAQFIDALRGSLNIYKKSFERFFSYTAFSFITYIALAIVVGLLLISTISNFPDYAALGTLGLTLALLTNLGKLVAVFAGSIIIFTFAKLWFFGTYAITALRAHNSETQRGWADTLVEAGHALGRLILLQVVKFFYVCWPFIIILGAYAVSAFIFKVSTFELVALLRVYRIILGLLGFASILYVFYASIKYMFADFYVVLEKMKPVEAARSAAALVRLRWWQTFGNLAGFGLSLTLINFVLGKLSSASFVPVKLLGIAGSVVFSVIVVPLGTIFMTVLFSQFRANPTPPPEPDTVPVQ